MLKETVIHESAIIYPGVQVGSGVYIGPYCVVGAPPEHRSIYEDGFSKGVVIEDGARLHSHVVVDAGKAHQTKVGALSLVSSHCHISSDCILGSGVVLGSTVFLASGTVVQDGATISSHSCTIERTVIGAHSFVGGKTYITKDIPPAEKWIGCSPRFWGSNDIGLEKTGKTYAQVISKYEEQYERLVASKA